MKKLASVAGLSLLLTGCITGTNSFEASSAPIPPNGYTVLQKKPVTGTNTQFWILFFGGSLSPQQPQAYEHAIKRSPAGTDALITVSVEQHNFSFFGIFSTLTTTVTGTPVKFN